MKRIMSFFIATTIALSPLSDTPLQLTALGFLGASVAFIPLLVAVLLALLFFLTMRRSVSVWLVPIAVWMILVSLYGLGVFDDRFAGETILSKGVRLFVLFGLFIAPIFLPLNHPWVKTGFFLGFFVALLGIIWGDVLAYDTWFHANPNINMRPRGFALESSHLSMVVLALGTVIVSLARQPMVKLGLGTLTISVLVYSGSKGGLAVLLAACVVLALFYSIKTIVYGRLAKTFIYALLFLPIITLGFVKSSQGLAQTLLAEAQSFTSSATRVTLVTSSLSVATQHPLGVGFTGYLPALVGTIPGSVKRIQQLSPLPLNFDEVRGYTTARTDQNISTKSFFFDGLIYFGFPFALVYFYTSSWLLWKLLLRREWTLFIGTAALLLGLIIFSGGLGLYTISFALGWARMTVKTPLPRVV